MTLNDLYFIVMSTILGETKLNFKSKWNLWNPIFNSYGRDVDCPDCKKEVAKYRSAEESLVDILEKESNVEYSKGRAAMDSLESGGSLWHSGWNRDIQMM